MALPQWTQADEDAIQRELAGSREMTMGLSFSDTDPVSRCHVKACKWYGYGDSINDAVRAWTAHLTAVHRSDWPE